MIDHLRARLVRDLSREAVMARGLYETLEKRHGLTLARAEDTVTARPAAGFEAALLGVASGDVVLLQVTRIVYLGDDEPLDAAIVVSRADRYAYRVSGRPRRATSPAG